VQNAGEILRCATNIFGCGVIGQNHVMLITGEEVKRQGEKSGGETIDDRYGV
jgi:hypothetical protein